MPDLMAEKFQITAPEPKKNDGANQWASFENQRRVVEFPAETYSVPRFGDKEPVSVTDKDMLTLPPGMFLENQNAPPSREFGYRFGDDPEGPDGKVSAKDLQEGFCKCTMSPVADMYTNEHVELFYGDAGGFVERNNYLDRS